LDTWGFFGENTSFEVLKRPGCSEVILFGAAKAPEDVEAIANAEAVAAHHGSFSLKLEWLPLKI